MCNCNNRRRTLYNELIGRGDIGNELEKKWDKLFGFQKEKAIESLAQCIKYTTPTTRDRENVKFRFQRAVAEVLSVYLDIRRVEIIDNEEVVFGGYRGCIDGDKSFNFSKRYIFRGITCAFDKVQVYSMYEICTSCRSQITKFLRSSEKIWDGNDIRIEKYYRASFLDETKESGHLNNNEITFLDRGSLEKDEAYEDIKDVPLLELGMSDTLQGFYYSTLSRMLVSMKAIGVKRYKSLFSVLFGRSLNGDQQQYIDPWAWNIVYQKSEDLKEKGFGYLLTENQIAHIFAKSKCWPSREKKPSFWPHFWNIYEQIDEGNNIDKIKARTTEAVWRLHGFDRFGKMNSEGVGVTRVARGSSLPAIMGYQEYSQFLEKVPNNTVRPLEDELVHNNWVFVLPIFSGHSILLGNRSKTTDSLGFKGLTWLMSNYPIPPRLRMSFLDITRNDESRIINWIEQFREETNQLRKNVRNKFEEDQQARAAHSYKEANVALGEAENIVSIFPDDLHRKEELKHRILDAKYCISGSFTSGNLSIHEMCHILRKTLTHMYLYRGKDIPGNSPVVIDISDRANRAINNFQSRDICKYIFNSVVSLAKNSVNADKRDIQENKGNIPPFRFKCVLDSLPNDDAIVVDVLDTAGGIRDDRIRELTKLFKSHQANWSKNIRLDSDLARWVFRLQTIFDKELDINKNHGWYYILSYPNYETNMEIKNISTSLFDGVNVTILISN